MLAELAEDRARGEVARIYREIRETTGVPYVSSLQRHLATRTGWLEWGWSVVGPKFRSGEIPAAVWHVAGALDMPRLRAFSASDLKSLGVTSEDQAAIHNVLDSFIRVSPTNLGFSGVLRRILLNRLEVDDAPICMSAQALPALAPLPTLVDVDALRPRDREVLMSMATTVDGELFVPGLYRMLVRWPRWFEAAVTALRPVRSQAEAACGELASRIDAIVPALMNGLDLLQPPDAGGDAERTRVIGAIDRYRETSPQMVVYCRMLKSSLS